MSDTAHNEDFVDDLVAICRNFGVFEKEQVCCGTVTVPQCVALQRLLTGEATDTGSLAEHLGISISATTRLVDGLERRAFVERVRDPEDRRRVFVNLTEAGNAEALRLRQASRDAIRLVLGSIPPERHRDVIDALGLVRGAVEDLRKNGIVACCP